MGLQEFLKKLQSSLVERKLTRGREPGGHITSFWQEGKRGEIGKNYCLPSLSPFLPLGCSMFPHFCRVRYFLTLLAGDTGGVDGV